MFSRRRINIESVNAAASGVEGIHRLTLVVYETEDTIKKLMQQIEKQVDVFKSVYNTNEEIISQEQIVYKVATNNSGLGEIESVFENFGGRRISENENYAVYETTGSKEKTDTLIKVLEGLGITEIVRGARIAVNTSESNFKLQLEQFV